MKKTLLVLLILPFLANAQNAKKLTRSFSDTLPNSFKLSTSLLREHIYDGIPPQLKDEKFRRPSFRFADQSAVQLSLLFESGQVYSDWPALEDYLNKIVAKIMPKELAQDSVIHAYLVKDGNFNAFMTPHGIMFVNIGLFDELSTEGALAGVLTHELAHYYLRHSLKRFVKAEKGEFNRIFQKSSASRFSVNNELQADSLAIVWMHQSGYGDKGMKGGIEAIASLQRRNLLRFEDIWEMEEVTHPGAEKRVAQIDSFQNIHPENQGSDFLVSKELFFTFKELAKSETLKCLLYSFDYDACIEKAFRFHLLNPNRGEYVYYLMEAIRRKCYLNVDYWSKKFITDRYYKIIPTKTGGKRKVAINDHLFKEFNAEILGLTKEEALDLPGKFYWEGELKFETYEEAFTFFAQVGNLLNEPECILSNALSVGFDPVARKKMLELYLAKENIKYRDYANCLLNNQIWSSLPNKTLTTMNDFFATVRQGSEEILIRNEQLVGANNLTPIVEAAIAGDQSRQSLDISELQNSNINDYIMLVELYNLAVKRLLAKGEKTELHILDPRYWQIMKKFQVNEFEFINFLYYDARKPEYSIDSYKEVLQNDYRSLLSEVKRDRYLEAGIFSIRIKENSYMKIQHYGLEVKVDYNKPAYERISEYIADNLKSKDKIAKQYDGKQK